MDRIEKELKLKSYEIVHDVVTDLPNTGKSDEAEEPDNIETGADSKKGGQIVTYAMM